MQAIRDAVPAHAALAVPLERGPVMARLVLGLSMSSALGHMFRESTMKPRSPNTLFTGTIVVAVVCAIWLASLTCRPAANATPQQPAHVGGSPPKA